MTCMHSIINIITYHDVYPSGNGSKRFWSLIRVRACVCVCVCVCVNMCAYVCKRVARPCDWQMSRKYCTDVSPAVRAFESEKKIYVLKLIALFGGDTATCTTVSDGGAASAGNTIIFYIMRINAYICVYIQTGFPRSKSVEECQCATYMYYAYNIIYYNITCIPTL